jgi:hypothetical protein
MESEYTGRNERKNDLDDLIATTPQQQQEPLAKSGQGLSYPFQGEFWMRVIYKP